jgi:SAM-dependent methyltransferase
MNETPVASDWASARGEKWRRQVAGMEAMLAPVDDPLIGALDLDQPYKIADIGCGGGGTTLKILRQAPAGSVVRGFDIAPALIELARGRAESAGDITFEVRNMATAAPDRGYDRLVSRFGIMFFDDAPGAFGNLLRWLRPGGRFAFAAWGRMAENPWITTVRDVVAEIIETPRPDPDAPGPFRYGEADKLLALLKQCGFDELHVRDWRGALSIGGGLPAEEAAKFALASFSTFSEQLAEAGERAVEQARTALTARFSPHEQNGAVRMDARVHIFTGMRSLS